MVGWSVIDNDNPVRWVVGRLMVGWSVIDLRVVTYLLLGNLLVLHPPLGALHRGKFHKSKSSRGTCCHKARIHRMALILGDLTCLLCSTVPLDPGTVILTDLPS